MDQWSLLAVMAATGLLGLVAVWWVGRWRVRVVRRRSARMLEVAAAREARRAEDVLYAVFRETEARRALRLTMSRDTARVARGDALIAAQVGLHVVPAPVARIHG